MPDRMTIYKAGKMSFLLVCLFLCVGCGGKKSAVFEAAESPVAQEIQVTEEKTAESIDTKEATKNESVTKLVNINTAGKEELMTLPGIGEVRAEAIIAHRKQTGEFEKIEDIMNVKGIKTGIFSKISSLICVK